MCGICGIINPPGRQPEAQHIHSMMKAMKHRGPDDEGTFFHQNIGFGFVRLSILDLSPAGHQPMQSKDGRYTIIYNGEIYNYIELREELKTLGHIFTTGTDTEVLLAAFSEWGRDCLHKLNGMWAFVFHDRAEKRIFASRDRYGIKPFYYTLLDGRFIFASEIPPILKVLSRKPEPDNDIIYDYLVHNRVDHSPRTFFEGIVKLPHGQTLEIRPDEKPEPTITRWYHLREEVEKREAFQNPDEFRELFEDSVKLRLRSDVPVGVCLSGGLDSSAIVSTLLNLGGHEKINTFSAVYGKGKRGDESEFIDEYKDLLPNRHFTVPTAEEFFEDMGELIRLHAEPFPSTSIYAQYRVMKLAREHVTVMLDGQGADELLAGYHYFFGFWFKDLLKSGRMPSLAREMNAYRKIHQSSYGFQSMLFLMMPSIIQRRVRQGQTNYLHPEFKKKTSGVFSDNLWQSPTLYDALLNHIEYKLEHLLKWEDRNSMHFSLEGRVPFLDYRLVEKTLALKGREVVKNGTTKYIFREAMKGVLPEKIRTRQDKIGFATPQDEWLKKGKSNFLLQNLENLSNGIERINFDQNKLIDLKKMYLNHRNVDSSEIWKVVNLTQWLQIQYGSERL